MKAIVFSFLMIVFMNVNPVHAIEWLDSMDEALAKAKTENKPILVYLYHSTSLAEDRKVWMSSLVQKGAEDFVAVQMNIESAPEIVQDKNVHTFPAILFFDSKGRELQGLRYVETSVLPSQTDSRGNVQRQPVKRALTRQAVAKRLKQVRDEIDEFALLESQFENYKNNPQIVLRYAKGLRMRGEFDKAEQYYSQLMDDNSVDPRVKQDAQRDYVMMYLSQATIEFYQGEYNQAVELMKRFLDIFPDDDKVPNAKLIMGMAMYESGHKNEGEKVLKTLAKDQSAGIYGQRAEMFLQEK